MKRLFKLLFIALLASASLKSFAQQGFVKVSGTQFTIDGKAYRYIGANYWYGGLLATNGDEGKKRLKTELDFPEKERCNQSAYNGWRRGASLLYPYRTPSEKALQPLPGKFDPKIIYGLDYLLNEMGKRNMKAVLHFTNTLGLEWRFRSIFAMERLWRSAILKIWRLYMG